MRVLAIDVPHILDEDTIVRLKPLKVNLGENVNTQIVESKQVDAFHNMKKARRCFSQHEDSDLEEEGIREQMSYRLARCPQVAEH